MHWGAQPQSELALFFQPSRSWFLSSLPRLGAVWAQLHGALRSSPSLVSSSWVFLETKLGASPPYCAGTPPGLSMWSSLKSLCEVYPVSEILICLVEGQGLNPVCDVNASAVKAPQVVRQRPWETLKFLLQQFSMLSIPSGWESMQRACQHWSSRLELWLYLLFSLLVGQVTITQLLHLKVWYLVPSLSVAGLIGQWVPHRVFFEVTEVIFLAAECVAPVCSFLNYCGLTLNLECRKGRRVSLAGLDQPWGCRRNYFCCICSGNFGTPCPSCGTENYSSLWSTGILLHLQTPTYT